MFGCILYLCVSDSGVMGVSNAFYGTKMLLNADLPEVYEYKKKYAIFLLTCIPIYVPLLCLSYISDDSSDVAD